MDCRTIRQLLPAFHEQELTGTEASEIEEHLLSCSKCRDMNSAIRESWGSLDVWEDAEVPRRVRESLVSRFARRRGMFWIKIALPAAAALILVFGLTVRYMGYRNASTVQLPSASTGQISAERADVNEDELIADLQILQEKDFFDSVEELVGIDYLPLVEESPPAGAEEQRSFLPVIVT